MLQPLIVHEMQQSQQWQQQHHRIYYVSIMYMGKCWHSQLATHKSRKESLSPSLKLGPAVKLARQQLGH